MKHVLSRINTKAVNVVRLNKRFNPGAVTGDNGRVFRVKIREWDLFISEPALLLACCITPLNWAVRVVQ